MIKIKTFYSLILIIFSFGIVSFVKNESRDIQKDIKELKSEIILLNKYFHEVSLDYQINSSPKNISYLANKYLDSNFEPFKKKKIKEYKIRKVK